MPNRATMRGAATPPRLLLAAFVLPRSLSKPVRSRQTEWQLLIGGLGAANQEGAPHVRAQSFKRRSLPARGGGWGGARAWKAVPGAGTRSQAPAARAPGRAGIGRLSPLANLPRALRGRGGGSFFSTLAVRPPVQSPGSGIAQLLPVRGARAHAAAMRLRKGYLLVLLLALAQLLAVALAGAPDAGEPGLRAEERLARAGVGATRNRRAPRGAPPRLTRAPTFRCFREGSGWQRAGKGLGRSGCQVPSWPLVSSPRFCSDFASGPCSREGEFENC